MCHTIVVVGFTLDYNNITIKYEYLKIKKNYGYLILNAYCVSKTFQKLIQNLTHTSNGTPKQGTWCVLQKVRNLSLSLSLSLTHSHSLSLSLSINEHTHTFFTDPDCTFRRYSRIPRTRRSRVIDFFKELGS